MIKVTSRWIPKSSRAVHIKNVEGAVVYVSERAGISAVAYSGKRNRADWHYTFKSVDSLSRYITQWVDGLKRASDWREKQKAERKAPHTLQLGDVLRSSWGYDQTNINFYEVTKVIGKSMVEVREIAQESKETSVMQGECIPVPGQYVSEPSRHRAVRDSITVDGHSASKLEPMIINGAKIYSASHWTNYA